MFHFEHFMITTLPQIVELGESPPMGLDDLLEHVQDHRKWREQIEAILLRDDLIQREAVMAGEIGGFEPTVLTTAQGHGDAPLPEVLFELAGETSATSPVDRLWEGYFRYAHALGRSYGSSFLVHWVEHEVAMRNALAQARAKRLGLEEAGYLVATDLSADTEDFTHLIREWEGAPTPLVGLRIILRARWDWIERYDAWFTFSQDEILAYAVRIMLLKQWRRTASEEEVESSASR